MSRASASDALLDRIYDAALDPGLWPSVLSSLVRRFHSQTGCLFERHLATGATTSLAADHLSSATFADYQAYYWKKDIWSPDPTRHRVESVMASRQIVSDTALLRSEFYNDFMKPRGLFYGIGGILAVDGTHLYMLGLHRPRRSGKPYDLEEMRDLQRLFPHLKRALEIRNRVTCTVAERDGLFEALDRLTAGAILFDTTGQVRHMNCAAQAICAQRDGLTIDQRTVRAAAPAETAQLHHLIAQSLSTTNGRGAHAGGSLTLSRPSGCSPYLVLVSPFGVLRRPEGGAPLGAIAWVSDPSRQPELPSALLARLYGLTDAESRLVLALLAGRSMEDSAAQLGRTYGTVRVQLKQIFHKTGVRRQAELIRLLLPYTSVLPDGTPHLAPR